MNYTFWFGISERIKAYWTFLWKSRNTSLFFKISWFLVRFGKLDNQTSVIILFWQLFEKFSALRTHQVLSMRRVSMKLISSIFEVKPGKISPYCTTWPKCLGIFQNPVLLKTWLDSLFIDKLANWLQTNVIITGQWWIGNESAHVKQLVNQQAEQNYIKYKESVLLLETWI